MRTRNIELMLIFLVAVAVMVTIGLVVWVDLKSNQLEQDHNIDAGYTSAIHEN